MNLADTKVVGHSGYERGSTSRPKILKPLENIYIYIPINVDVFMYSNIF